jgi:hypothetical protein
MAERLTDLVQRRWSNAFGKGQSVLNFALAVE